MLETVKVWIDRHSLLTAGDTVLAACSGGPDSVALVHILYTLREEYQIKLAVAHVNHMLRAAESDQDALFVARFCEQYHLPLYETRVNVRQLCEETGLSTQEAARILRFRFLRETAAELDGANIATGHHRDDQIETVLLHVFRGTGSAGLSGMKPKDAGIIRPLLSVSRTAIEEYCLNNQLASRTDSSNLKTNYLRNRIRLHLLPHLQKEYNPGIGDALWRTSLIAADEHDFIRSEAEKCGVITTAGGSRVRIDRQGFSRLKTALQREVIRLALEKSRGDLKGITFDHVETLIHAFLNGRVGTTYELPGIVVTIAYDHVEMGTGLTTVGERTVIKPPGIEVNIPGDTVLPELGITIRAELFYTRCNGREADQAIFDWDAVKAPVYVRTRAQGDRFQPMGMTGTKKIKDFFIDCKIPQENRDKVAIFSDEQGILWIGGYRQSDRGKISRNTKHFLRLSIIKQEELQHD